MPWLDATHTQLHWADVEAITRCVEEVKQELAQIKAEVKAKPPPEPTKAHILAWVKPKNQSVRKKNNGVKGNYDGILFRGIPESMGGTVRELYVEDVEQVKRIFIFLAVENCPIDDVKRIETYDQNKNQKLLVNLSNEHQRLKILPSAHKMQNGNLRKKVYISRKLNPKEKQSENEILHFRRNLLNSGVNPRELRIQQLRLHQRNWQQMDLHRQQRRVETETIVTRVRLTRKHKAKNQNANLQR